MNKKKLTVGQKCCYCYSISNLTVMMLIYVVYIFFILQNVRFFLMRIVLYILGYFCIGYFEERVLIRIVNPVVEFFIPKKWKEYQKERVANNKQKEKVVRNDRNKGSSRGK